MLTIGYSTRKPNPSPFGLLPDIDIKFPEINASAEVAVQVEPLKSDLKMAEPFGGLLKSSIFIALSIGSFSQEVKKQAVKIKNNPITNLQFFMFFIF